MSNPPDSFQIQIVGETIKEYKIQKTGTDPKTSEPWATQWISKNLVAKDVVAVWKEKLNEVLKEWHEGSQGRRKGVCCGLPFPSYPRLRLLSISPADQWHIDNHNV
jgi:hypothetical protein